MKILLLGADGQLGWQLRRSLAPLGEVVALTRGSTQGCGDLARHAELAATVRAVRPDVVVNAAAFTDVDGAEARPDEAMAVNATACQILATTAQACGAWMLHFSTDYVFDGSGDRPWRETDAARPLGAYGRSKLAGDEAVMRHAPLHLVLRAGWLFDTWGRNFVKTVLRAARAGTPLRLVNDQWGAPTRAAALADVAAHLLRMRTPETAGLYHVSPAGEATWEQVARHVVAQAQSHGWAVAPEVHRWPGVPAKALGRPAPRPANSRLDASRLRERFGLALPDWRTGVDAVVAELVAGHEELA